MTAQDRDSEKIFNDPVHGPITLPSLCVSIIDTPQFQRLRNIKQLGGKYYVYPGASHNRFEHSIGVCHLAGELIKKLQKDQQELNITKQQVLCVEIAGLCHDLGHGPLSHVFDEFVIPKLEKLKGYEKWKHEDASLMMFDYMLEDNKTLREQFEKELGDDEDKAAKKNKDFIKKLIKPPEEDPDDSRKGYEEHEKKFLFQIVANEKNKIDVDKWDYFARDCHHLGMQNNFDHRRLIKFARVIKDEICYRDKEENNLYEMFHTREMLHRRAYQHKTALIVEYMIAEAMRLANKHLTFTGKDGSCTLHECIRDAKAYTSLDDTVLWLILNQKSEQNTCKELEEARNILRKIQRRKHHRFIHSECVDERPDLTQLEKVVNNSIEQQNISGIEIVIVPSYFNFGFRDKDPIQSVHFYSKRIPKQSEPVWQGAKQAKSKMRYQSFEEHVLNFYMKKIKMNVEDEETNVDDATFIQIQNIIIKAFSKYENVSTAKKHDSAPSTNETADDVKPASKQDQESCGNQDDGDQ